MTSLLSLAPLFSTASPSERELTEIETCSALIAQRRAMYKRNTEQQLWTWRPRAEDAR